jgi:hypothetical protein
MPGQLELHLDIDDVDPENCILCEGPCTAFDALEDCD